MDAYEVARRGFSDSEPQLSVSWLQLALRKELRPYHKCRYKPSLWIPYITYKEEILSLSPYASLFYEVIYDNEMNALKEFVSGKLTRGQVELHDAEAKQHVSSTRTSDLGWITDSESPIAARLSARVEDITWLDTEQRLPAGPFSGEAFQVVNYGLGGHYVAHWDPVKHPLAIELKQSGTRIATFLYYLSDVEKGGNTAFVNAGISVAPVKGMALFWYNYNPAMDLEELTLHTGCPVLKGHKWTVF
nr:hypothetical protein BaRGS_021490 [Batillaria attramentaria]